MTKALHATAMNSRGADYQRTYHHVTVEPPITLADVLEPRFWAHHVDKIRIGDLMDVIAVDDAFDVQMRAVEKGVGFVRFRILRLWQPQAVAAKVEAAPQEDQPIPAGYDVNFAPMQRWRVIMKDPQQIISKDHRTKADAIAAAVAHAAKATAVAA